MFHIPLDLMPPKKAKASPRRSGSAARGGSRAGSAARSGSAQAAKRAKAKRELNPLRVAATRRGTILEAVPVGRLDRRTGTASRMRVKARETQKARDVANYLLTLRALQAKGGAKLATETMLGVPGGATPLPMLLAANNKDNTFSQWASFQRNGSFSPLELLLYQHQGMDTEAMKQAMLADQYAKLSAGISGAPGNTSFGRKKAIGKRVPLVKGRDDIAKLKRHMFLSALHGSENPAAAALLMDELDHGGGAGKPDSLLQTAMMLQMMQRDKSRAGAAPAASPSAAR